MQRVAIGTRTENPAYFDMAARFPWEINPQFYGRGFRIGDRAAAYIRVLHWRLENPHRRLVILDDSTFPECEHAAPLSAEWLFAGLADEIWKLSADEVLPSPPLGENLYDQGLWYYWKELRYYKPGNLKPAITPDPKLVEKIKHDLPGQGISDKFILVQPLIDATYNVERNRNPQWWATLIEHLCTLIDVVMVGTQKTHEVFGNPQDPRIKAFVGNDPMATLALSTLASGFVGGETGFTLWAPILSVPTVGLMSEAHISYRMDTAPLSFGAPVDCFPHDDEPKIVAAKIAYFLARNKIIS
jgi:hypothetical protein